MKRTAGEIIMHPLWLFPVFLIGVFTFIEGIHTTAHWRMKIDTHGYCYQNKEHLERQDDDW